MRILFIIGIFICSSLQAIEIPTLQEAIDLGKKGEQLEQEQRYSEALNLTRQAIFKTQQIAEHEQAWLIRWKWQLGRILKAQGNIDSAIEVYKQARDTLVPEEENNFQWETKGNLLLYKKLRTMFLELTDLLLQQANLTEAIITIEKLKKVGLRNYFGECFKDKVKTPINDIPKQTAIIYPILLSDRLELLVKVDSQIVNKTVYIEHAKIIKTVKNLLIQLQKGQKDILNKDYLIDSQQLYHWLISPLLPLLNEHEIKTLVFVPEDILNALPIAALHDGEKFIVQQFAIAITPTLSLTEASKKSNTTKVLLSAITESVQGYTRLTDAIREVETITNLYDEDILLNKYFTKTNFTERLSKYDYDIIHIVSHAEFAENIKDSFILTYDSKLTLNELEKHIEHKTIDLITLSACNTAAGDQGWTALGLSGVALKAGAKSALATLWKVDDKATSFLIKKFYNNLRSSSKVQALHKTQQEFLHPKSKYKHPFYWAPLILIGSWL